MADTIDEMHKKINEIRSELASTRSSENSEIIMEAE